MFIHIGLYIQSILGKAYAWKHRMRFYIQPQIFLFNNTSSEILYKVYIKHSKCFSYYISGYKHAGPFIKMY